MVVSFTLLVVASYRAESGPLRTCPCLPTWSEIGPILPQQSILAEDQPSPTKIQAQKRGERKAPEITLRSNQLNYQHVWKGYVQLEQTTAGTATRNTTRRVVKAVPRAGFGLVFFRPCPFYFGGWPHHPPLSSSGDALGDRRRPRASHVATIGRAVLLPALDHQVVLHGKRIASLRSPAEPPCENSRGQHLDRP